MEKTNSYIRQVFWIFFGLFVALIIYIVFNYTVKGEAIATNPNNPRLTILNENIKRGYIFDTNKNILADSNFVETKFKRNYPYANDFVHLLGNVSYQYSGVEAKYNFDLQKLNFEILQRLEQIITEDHLVANDIVLTVDLEFQKFVASKLTNYKGAIVCLEPSTGKILALVSNPTYNPNTIAEDWSTLSTDEDNSPLLNRATKGLYPPGSVFKIITAMQIMRTIPDYEDYFYECKGHETFGDNTIQCYNKNIHGSVNLTKAFTVSCNTYFAHMGTKFNNDEFKALAEQLYFNKNYPFPLEHSKSSFVLSGTSSLQETVQTSFGQGRTLMTPLHIAMITSAIANKGIMMEPYILDYAQTPKGFEFNKTVPKMIESIMTPDEAIKLTDLMWNVVSYGTGRGSIIQNIELAGKTGTAQNETNQDHGLYTAFAPSDNPDIVVTVVLEQSNGTGPALPITRDIISYYLNNIK